MPLSSLADLDVKVCRFASGIDVLPTPTAVLNELHNITTNSLPLRVLGAARLPFDVSERYSPLGKSAFLHTEVPKGWWEEYAALAPERLRPLLFLANSRMAPCTWSQAKQMLDPIGTDRWAFELALKYGMRDGLSCPVGRQWLVVFWSRRDLSKVLKTAAYNMVFAAASIAALRLERLIGPDANRIGSAIRLTSRETAVLRLVSGGAQTREVAQALGLGEETIRTHLKKAQIKLGVHNRTHAVAEALRQSLIP